MTHTSKTIVFFGSGPVAAKSLEFLATRFTIEMVITKAKPPHHKGIAPVEALVDTLGLPVLFANNKQEVDQLLAQHPLQSSVGVIIDYGVLLSEAVIQSFPLGIINSHFSLLPEWRGADPITFSVLSGQLKTGVSLMVIDMGLDTGKLIGQKSLFIDQGETTDTLTDRLITLSNQMLAEYLPLYQEGNIKPRQQPHPDRATYSRKLTKSDSILDWQKPAAVLEGEIRAFKGWPGSKTTLGVVEAVITSAHVDTSLSLSPGELKIADTSLFIGTSEGSLAIDYLKPIGKKEMPIQAFLAGYRSKLV